MRPLNATDEAFLRADTIRSVGHAGTVLVFDGSGLPAGTHTAEALRNRIAAMLPELPPLRWRLTTAPDDPERHCWVDEDLPDLRDHVRELDLGPDAGAREIAAAVDRLSARPLRRSRPLWEMHVLTGLAGGRVAVYFRFHHALGDGAAILGMENVLFPPDQATFSPPPPVSPASATDGAVPEPDLPEAPLTRFNQALCGARNVALADVSLPRMLELKRAAGVSFVGLFAAITAGALRSWLAERDELPADPLLAMIPTSNRRPGEGAIHSNVIGTLYLPLPTDEADPRRRVQLVHEHLEAAKRTMAPRDTPTRDSGRRVNLTITTVPGIPLAWAGAPLAISYPIGVVATSGLVAACVSRGERAGLGLQVDREQGEGGWSLIDALLGEFAELDAAYLQAVTS